MTVSSTAAKSDHQMQLLSESIIDTLREISANRQPLNVASLSLALTRNQLVSKLLTAPSPDTPTRDEALVTQMQALRAELTRAAGQKDDFSRQSEESQKLAQETRLLMKRCVLALLTLTFTPQNKFFYQELNDLRGLVIQDAAMFEIEDALSKLKDIVHKKDLEENGAECAPEPGFWGRFLKKKETAPEMDLAKEVQLKQWQQFFCAALNLFSFDFDKDDLRCYAPLPQRIRESVDMEQLVATLDDFLALMRIHLKVVDEERRQVTGFIADISNGVLEMENHLLVSINRSTRNIEAESTFTCLIEGQMDEMRDSFQMTKTLAEIKEVISTKLTSIRSAIDEKKQEDLRRQEETCRELGHLQENLKNMKCEIVQVQERSKALEIESMVDALTEVPNRRAYDRRIKDELQRFQRYQQIFSLLLLDIDHFKNVNDRYGHKAGDKCLREVIRRVKPALRETDFLSRYGGEEFVIIVPGIGREDAANMAERLCRLVERTRFTYHSEQIPLTISIGVTQADPADRDPDTMFNRVDSAMYQAKKTGRNRVVSL